MVVLFWLLYYCACVFHLFKTYQTFNMAIAIWMSMWVKYIIICCIIMNIFIMIWHKCNGWILFAFFPFLLWCCMMKATFFVELFTTDHCLTWPVALSHPNMYSTSMCSPCNSPKVFISKWNKCHLKVKQKSFF